MHVFHSSCLLPNFSFLRLGLVGLHFFTFRAWFNQGTASLIFVRETEVEEGVRFYIGRYGDSSPFSTPVSLSDIGEKAPSFL